MVTLLGSVHVRAEEDLDLTDPKDLDVLNNGSISEEGTVQAPSEANTKNPAIPSLNDEIPPSNLTEGTDLNLSSKEEQDDLESLKDDIGQVSFENSEEKKEIKKQEEKKETIEKGSVVNDGNEKINILEEKAIVFDVGKEEKILLEEAKLIQGKMPSKEWSEISSKSKQEKYSVVEGDYLWKIAKKFFGSGFFYAKIWSLNPYITNPHEVKPGMILTFDTGSSEDIPSIKVGEFDESMSVATNAKGPNVQIDVFGSEAKPEWIDERQKLQEQGIYVQYASDATYEDLANAAKQSENKEYEKYEPPTTKITIEEAKNRYDESGFDKESKISFRYKEGFFLNTFVTTNIVQDFGEITNGIKAGILFSTGDTIYVKFDKEVHVMAGEMYSIYGGMGKAKHKSSEREGYKYGINGQIRTVRKIDDKWECVITDTVSTIQRGDRITVYTPKIPQITKTFNDRVIEASVLDGYSEIQSVFSLGNVIYLDRGRADGVEMGNVFDVYDFTDRLNNKKITKNPTYKIGEITVITLTDNFATGLITNSIQEIVKGSVAVTKSTEEAARTTKLKDKNLKLKSKELKEKAIDELDVELNLNDINEDLLEKADKVQLNEDELEELERQEREKSLMREGERDLKSLEKLEKEIESAEKQISEAKLDEDRLLENQNLEVIEKNVKVKDGEEQLSEIEKEFGKKYLDEDLNNKDNPYGLTEFDLEEVDELLNTDKRKTKSPVKLQR